VVNRASVCCTAAPTNSETDIAVSLSSVRALHSRTAKACEEARRFARRERSERWSRERVSAEGVVPPRFRERVSAEGVVPPRFCDRVVPAAPEARGTQREQEVVASRRR